MNRFEKIAEDFLFGPGYVTVFTSAIFKIRKIIQARFEQHPYSHAQSKDSSHTASNLLHPPTPSHSVHFLHKSEEEDRELAFLGTFSQSKEYIEIDGVQFTYERSATRSRSATISTSYAHEETPELPGESTENSTDNAYLNARDTI